LAAYGGAGQQKLSNPLAAPHLNAEELMHKPSPSRGKLKIFQIPFEGTVDPASACEVFIRWQTEVIESHENNRIQRVHRQHCKYGHSSSTVAEWA
jgi:hypothetical protein